MACLFTTVDTSLSVLHTLYPNDDDVHTLGKRTRTATAGLLASLAAVDGPALGAVCRVSGGGGGGGAGGGGGSGSGAPALPPVTAPTVAPSAASLRAAMAADAAAAAHRTVKAYLSDNYTLTREYPKVSAAQREVKVFERKVEERGGG